MINDFNDNSIVFKILVGQITGRYLRFSKSIYADWKNMKNMRKGYHVKIFLKVEII